MNMQLKKEDVMSSFDRLLKSRRTSPTKLVILGLIYAQHRATVRSMTKDPMRGWRPLEQEYYVDMIKDVDALYRKFGTLMTIDLFLEAIKLPSALRAIQDESYIGEYRLFCSALYELPTGSLLVTFPQRGNWSRHVQAFVMGDVDRASCERVTKQLTYAFKYQWERTNSQNI